MYSLYAFVFSCKPNHNDNDDDPSVICLIFMHNVIFLTYQSVAMERKTANSKTTVRKAHILFIL